MKKSLKWIVGVFSFFVIVIVFLAFLPFVIDLNKFKPQIQDAVSNNLNAKVDFASARLTILTGLGFELKDVDIENADDTFKGTKLLHVKNLDFKLELAPLMQKKFVGYIQIREPEILILNNGEKNNLSVLQKTVSKGEQKEQKKLDPDSEKNKSGSESSFLSDFLVKSLVVKNANITFQDVAKGEKSKPILIRDLDMNVKNIGFDKDMVIDLSTDLSVDKPNAKVTGPVVLNLVSNTHMLSSKWQYTDFKGKIDFDKVSANFQNAFVKSNKTPFYLSFEGKSNPEETTVKNLKLSLENLLAKMSMITKHKDGLNSTLDLNLSSKHMEELKPFFPKHEKLLSKGSFDLVLHAQGALKQWDRMKSNMKLDLNLLNSDLSLDATTASLKPLDSTFQLRSKSLHLGEILKPFQKKDDKSDSIDMDKIIISNLSTNGHVSDTTLLLNKLNMNIFSGLVSSTHVDTNFKEKSMPFNGNATTKDLDVKQIIELVQKDKSPISGKFDMNSTFNGHAGNDELSKTLNAKGHFLFHDGFTTSNRELVAKSINKVTETLFHFSIPPNPLAQAGDMVLQKLNLTGKEQSKVSDISSDFEIKDGKLVLSKIAVGVLKGTIQTTVEGVKDTIKDGVKKGVDEGVKKLKDDPKKFLKDTFGF